VTLNSREARIRISSGSSVSTWINVYFTISRVPFCMRLLIYRQRWKMMGFTRPEKEQRLVLMQLESEIAKSSLVSAIIQARVSDFRRGDVQSFKKAGLFGVLASISRSTNVSIASVAFDPSFKLASRRLARRSCDTR